MISSQVFVVFADLMFSFVSSMSSVRSDSTDFVFLNLCYLVKVLVITNTMIA